MISVDTWRAEVAEEVLAAGADLINDTWGGADPRYRRRGRQCGAGLVCAPHRRPGAADRPARVVYEDVVADVLDAPGARRTGRRAGCAARTGS